MPELPEIWIGGVEQRTKLGFSPEEGLIARRIRELERSLVPVRIGEDKPSVVCDRNRKWIGGVAVGPEKLASACETGIQLRATRRVFEPAVDAPGGFDLGGC